MQPDHASNAAQLRASGVVEAPGRGSTLADLLRHARARRRISQLDLALTLGVSQRHISFVEGGRSIPSRQLLIAWLLEVGATDSVRNAALIHAGYAPSGRIADGPDGAERAPHKALSKLIAHHDPFPGIVFDADWIVRAANSAASWLAWLVMPDFMRLARSRSDGVDMISALVHANGLLSHMREPLATGKALLGQLQSEALVRPSLRLKASALAAALSGRFDWQHDPAQPPASDTHLHQSFETEHGDLSFFTVRSLVGLPQNVTVSSLRAELWFPADSHTRAVLERQVRGVRPTGDGQESSNEF